MWNEKHYKRKIALEFSVSSDTKKFSIFFSFFKIHHELTLWIFKSGGKNTKSPPMSAQMPKKKFSTKFSHLTTVSKISCAVVAAGLQVILMLFPFNSRTITARLLCWHYYLESERNYSNKNMRIHAFMDKMFWNYKLNYVDRRKLVSFLDWK